MAKKNYGIRMEPDIAEELKTLCLKYKKPMGEIIEGLIEFSKSGNLINDTKFKERFDNLLDMSMANAGIRGGWIIPSDMKDNETKLDYIRRKTQEDIAKKQLEMEQELKNEGK